MSGPELEFHNRLEILVKNQLHIQEPAAKLLAMYYGDKDDAVLVLLEVRAPCTVYPATG